MKTDIFFRNFWAQTLRDIDKSDGPGAPPFGPHLYAPDPVLDVLACVCESARNALAHATCIYSTFESYEKVELDGGLQCLHDGIIGSLPKQSLNLVLSDDEHDAEGLIELDARRESVARQFADQLGRCSPSFNRVKFLQACKETQTST